MKNILLEAIETRRSVCRYREERLSPAQPDAVPETGTDAPTSGLYTPKAVIRKINPLFFLFLLLLSGCKNDSRDDWPATVRLDPAVRDSALPLESTVMDASRRFIYAKTFWVYRDSILVVLNKPSRKAPFVEFYDFRADRLLNRSIALGNGPGEMLNTRAQILDNKLFVDDFAKNRLACIDIDSAIRDSGYRPGPFFKYTSAVGSPWAAPYREGQVILINPFCFKDETLGIDNQAPRFLLAGNDRPLEIRLNDKPYFAYNVNNGNILPNPGRNKIVYTSMDLPLIEIYDYDLNPVKRITGPDKLEPAYRIDRKGDVPDICFSKIIPYAYTSSCYDNNYFYLSYVGDFLTKEKDPKQFSSLILQFDWEGNFVESYFSPRYIRSLSKGAGKDVFYATGYDEDGLPVVYRLSPKKERS